jgi:hypothetical protein
MNRNTRIAVLGGLVTASLALGIATAAATDGPPPVLESPADRSATADDVGVGGGELHPTWLVRPRPGSRLTT